MKQPVKQAVFFATFLWGIILILLHSEWPMPDWARQTLDKKLGEFAVELDYKRVYFDLLGNIRLVDIQGHYQGLLDFSARQILIRLLPLRGPEIVIDSGEFHTGFLRLPIPETIQFSGTIQKQTDGIFFRDTRFKANSLVMLVHGIYAPAKPSTKDASSALITGNSSLEKAVAGFLEKLCADKTLWVAQLEIAGSSSNLTLAGKELDFGSYKVLSPVLSLSRPLSKISISADEVDFPMGWARDVDLAYNAGEKNLWRAVAGDTRFLGEDVSTASAMAHLPLNSGSSLKNMKDIAASVGFSDGTTIYIQDGSLSPLKAKLWGNLPSTILPTYGVNIKTKIAGFFSAVFENKNLSFDCIADKGNFYGLDFDHLRARGVLSRESTQIDRFDVASGDSHAAGGLKYDFSMRRIIILLGKLIRC